MRRQRLGTRVWRAGVGAVEAKLVSMRSNIIVAARTAHPFVLLETQMKLYGIASVLVATSIALPAAAQAWYDPANLIHNSYVEVEGGAATEGRTKIGIEGQGLGASAQSASQDHDFFGGGLVGYKLAPGIAIEGEGIYSRNRLSYSPTNAVFGVGGATRTYGGLGNLRFSLPKNPTFSMNIASHPIKFGIEPYVAGGVGYGNVQYTGRNGAFSYVDDQDGLIFQGKAGIEFHFGEHIGFDISYRYLQSPDYTTPGSFVNTGYSALTRSHIQAATGGLKYYF